MEPWELDAYRQLTDLLTTVNQSQLVKSPTPTETSIGGGSRDMMQQDATGWGVENLTNYLLANNGDPLGVLDPAAVRAFLDPINARAQELATRDPYLNYGVETEPSRVFSNFTTPQLQAYLDRLRSDYIAAGNRGNDAMWLPRLEGNKVVWGQRNSGGGGLLDAITGMVEPAFALSGLAPLTGLATGTDFLTALQGAEALGAGAGGAMDMGIGGVGEAMGVGGTGAGAGGAFDMGIGGIGEAMGATGGIDPTLGLSPSSGFSPGSYNPADPLGLGTTTASPITNTAPVGEFTASQLPGGALNPVGTGVLGTGAPLSEISIPGVNTTPVDMPTVAPTTPSTPAGTGAATALGRILNGTATAADWASVLGIAGGAALNWIGQNNYSDALTNIANQARQDRLPFLNKATEWFNNPESYYSGEPAKAAMNATLRGLSVSGNPFGSGTSLALANEAGLRDWRNAWTGAANIGLSGQDSRNALLASSANADRGGLAGIGSAIGQLTTPANSLEGILRNYLGGSNYVLP